MLMCFDLPCVFDPGSARWDERSLTQEVLHNSIAPPIHNFGEDEPVRPGFNPWSFDPDASKLSLHIPYQYDGQPVISDIPINTYPVQIPT